MPSKLPALLVISKGFALLTKMLVYLKFGPGIGLSFSLHGSKMPKFASLGIIVKWTYIFDGSSTFSWEEGFKNSKYCLHVKDYEVSAARLSDSINSGCITVIISNYYYLPFANVLDWSKFSVIINQRDITLLRAILLGINKGNVPEYVP
ncbi:hypothetical protein Tsubulata_033217 [Turnera subulata]|uniref:Exostosin GT47 domain-containing protein n=1 Tax=Turnera subulata TaxID=218843 RepID=A0A9Q0F6R2_9ROSI|nr:hypothetical protein Tsubulata_033217 [Turnera subulata]